MYVYCININDLTTLSKPELIDLYLKGLVQELLNWNLIVLYIRQDENILQHGEEIIPENKYLKIHKSPRKIRNRQLLIIR